VIKMAFKDRLKKLRGDKNITQEDLAAALDLPPSTIRRYESAKEGHPKNERLEAIADYFGCSVDYLLERSNEKNGVSAKEREEFIDIIKLPESEAVDKIKMIFGFEGKNISIEMARAIYHFSLGQAKK
jgi:transcriptional regulator with XRE-family HTH domain